VQTHHRGENGVTQAGPGGHFPPPQGSYNASFSPAFSKHLCFLSPIHCRDFLNQNTKHEVIYPESNMKCQTTIPRGITSLKYLQLLLFLRWPSAPGVLPNPFVTFTERSIKNPAEFKKSKDNLTNLKLFLIQLWKTQTVRGWKGPLWVI